MITTPEAAKRFNLNQKTILFHIKAGHLPAQKIGRDWLIEEKNIHLILNLKRGRPKKRL